MCRLLGIRNFEFDQQAELIERFIQLARTGVTLKEDPPGHADGWGIGYYCEGKPTLYKSKGSLFDEAEDLRNMLAAVKKAEILILHLRKSAWPQTTTKEHAHPFQYNNYIFAHNGTVRDYKRLLPSINLKDVSLETALDTEVFLYYILSFPGHTRQAFQSAIDAIEKNNTYSSLNSLFSDGKQLFAYRAFTKYPEYYTLYHACSGNTQIICSEPILSSLSWKLLSQQQLVVL